MGVAYKSDSYSLKTSVTADPTGQTCSIFICNLDQNYTFQLAAQNDI